jgi:hypothetical protein
VNNSIWDLALEYWPIALYVPAVLVVIATLVVIIGFVDRDSG